MTKRRYKGKVCCDQMNEAFIQLLVSLQDIGTCPCYFLYLLLSQYKCNDAGLFQSVMDIIVVMKIRISHLKDFVSRCPDRMLKLNQCEVRDDVRREQKGQPLYCPKLVVIKCAKY